MAAQFSMSGPGLTSLPGVYSDGALLILTDQNPPLGHDPERICAELAQTLGKCSWAGVLLDFEREPAGLSRAICAGILAKTAEYGCFCAMPETYAAALPGAALFAPAPPLLSRPETAGRPRLWELAPRVIRLRLRESDCRQEPVEERWEAETRVDEATALSYTARARGAEAELLIRDTRQSLLRLLKEPGTLGGVALPREWTKLPSGAEAEAVRP